MLGRKVMAQGRAQGERGVSTQHRVHFAATTHSTECPAPPGPTCPPSTNPNAPFTHKHIHPPARRPLRLVALFSCCSLLLHFLFVNSAPPLLSHLPAPSSATC